MSVIEEPTPTMAQEDANSTTTLALAPESEQLSTTIVLEKKKAALEFWCARRDLHESGCKDDRRRCDIGVHRGRQRGARLPTDPLAWARRPALPASAGRAGTF